MNIFSRKILKLSEALGKYISSIRADDLYSPRTVEKYMEIGRCLIGLVGDVRIRDIDDDFVTNMKIKLNERSLSESRRNHYLTLVKNILAFLSSRGEKVYDGKKIKKYRIPAKPVKYLHEEQIREIIAAAQERTLTQLRLKTLILCLFSTGARISELISLNIDDVDFEGGTATVCGKGRKIRKILFNDDSITYLKRYLSMRDDDCPALFSTIKGKKKSRWAVNDIERCMRNLGKKMNLDFSLTCHCWRRSIATHMCKEGVPVSAIATLLGHSSIQTTEKFYLGDLRFNDVASFHRGLMNGKGWADRKGGIP